MTVFLLYQRAYVVVHLLRLLGSGGLAGAYGPHGFVGYHDVGKLVGGETEKTLADLFLHHVELCAGLALGQFLAAAEDRTYVVGQQLFHLVGDGFVAFVVVGATFGVSHNAVVHLHRFQHGCRHLASVGSALVLANVLCANGEERLLRQVTAHLQEREGGTDNHLVFGFGQGFHLFGNGFDKLVGIVESFVHFPVSGYYFFSHNL